MDELIDILDANGKPKGTALMKSEAHRRGLFHSTVHIWFYTLEGHVLVQQRGRKKNTYPLLWDVSVAGHVGAGETIEDSAVREVQEEIGLKITPIDLQKIGVFKSIQKHAENLTDCEFHHTFLCKMTKPVEDLKKQESEVEDLAFIPISIFKRELTQTGTNKYVPHKKAYYETIVKSIEDQLIAIR